MNRAPARPRLTNMLASAGIFLGSAVGVCATAHAQLAPDRPALNQPSGAMPSRFTRIEQTVGDVDPLGRSTRQLSNDLRLPTGFHDVYRIQGSAGDAFQWGFTNPTGGDLFARMDGAVTAVFPQSVYVDTRRGTIPLIPPGTIFFIGELPFSRFGWNADTAGAPVSSERIDTRVDTRAVADPPPSHVSRSGSSVSATLPDARRDQNLPAASS